VDADSSPAGGYHAGAMFTVYEALEAFLHEHRRCGEMDGGVEDGRVWMTCSCEAGLSRSLARPDRLRPGL
jgi:hypothetical protein